MPKFLVQLISVFSPGEVDTPAEEVSDDFLGQGQALVTLAAWPLEPLEIEADDMDEAERLARAEWQRQGATVHLGARISKERYARLLRGPRPGWVGGQTSVWTTWDVQPVDGG